MQGALRSHNHVAALVLPLPGRFLLAGSKSAPVGSHKIVAIRRIIALSRATYSQVNNCGKIAAIIYCALSQS
jgi:hypothetical protein